MNCSLEVKALNVEIEYRRVLRTVTFCVKPGQLCLLKGPNGSGKSTLLSVLAGLLAEYEGEVCWYQDGSPLDRYTLVTHMVYLNTRLGLCGQLSVAENLQWMAALQGVSIPPEQLPSILNQLGLSVRLLERKVSVLSSGQQQKVKLARLLLNTKPIWLLDEPFTALDVDTVSALEQIMAENVASGGLVVYASHHQAGRLSPDVVVELNNPVL